jgi:hypothetical protein
LSSTGAEANGISWGAGVSADGRLVAFTSSATNLVADDTNSCPDVFVRDLDTGETRRVSVASDGSQGNGMSSEITLSGDSRYVVFVSLASNLVDGDTNGTWDVFVHDLQTSTTTRVSVSSSGAQADGSSSSAHISTDGRYVAFGSVATNLVPVDTNNVGDVFLHDRVTHQTTLVSVSSDGSQAVGSGYSVLSDQEVVSGSSQYVAFGSIAANLVTGDTNNTRDIFLHEVASGQTTRVSVATDGTEGDKGSERPSLSFDGRYVAFQSLAGNLVAQDTNTDYDIFVRDRLFRRHSCRSQPPAQRPTASPLGQRSQPMANRSPSARTPLISCPTTTTGPGTSSFVAMARLRPRHPRARRLLRPDAHTCHAWSRRPQHLHLPRLGHLRRCHHRPRRRCGLPPEYRPRQRRHPPIFCDQGRWCDSVDTSRISPCRERWSDPLYTRLWRMRQATP